MKNQFPKIIFVLVLVACSMLYLLTVPDMPEVIGSLFAGDGSAKGYMTRSFYLPYIYVFGIGMPALLALMISVLPGIVRGRLPVGLGALGRVKDEASILVLKPFGWWYSSFVALFVASIHVLLLQANRVEPPTLSNGPFFVLFTGFMVISLAWVSIVVVRARRNPA